MIVRERLIVAIGDLEEARGQMYIAEVLHAALMRNWGDVLDEPGFSLRTDEKVRSQNRLETQYVFTLVYEGEPA